MMEKSKDLRGQIQMTCPESLVPADRPLRKIDKAVDFNRIYGMVEHLYPAFRCIITMKVEMPLKFCEK
jgi:hypothetical protein